MVVKKRRQRVYDNWIGAPLSSGKPANFFNNKPIDFFKTNKKDYPVNMFGDSDRDGVMNVFDCKPNNPNKQGILSAIAGAVTGAFKGRGVRQGWSEGMAKPGIKERRIYERTGVLSPRLLKIQEERTRGGKLSQRLRTALEKKGLSEAEIENARQAIIIAKLKQRGQSYQDMIGKISVQNKIAEQIAQQEFGKRPLVRAAKYVYGGVQAAPGIAKGIVREIPGLRAIATPQKQVREYETQVTKWKTVPMRDEQGNKIPGKYEEIPWRKRRVMVTKMKPVSTFSALRNYQMQQIERLKTGKLSLVQKERAATAKKGLQMIFPMIPAVATKATYGFQSKGGQMKSPGRPRGSVKYVDSQGNPIGVFAWRALQSQKRQAFREALRQQEEQLKQQRQVQRMQTLPQYEQVQQVPQEVQGATPEYSQFQQLQGQVPQEMPQIQQMTQQYVQQTPQQAPQQEIATVFKSSGGKPYPAVNRQPMASARATVPYGYVESVDSFTGRRFLKRLPPPERWAGGGG